MHNILGVQGDPKSLGKFQIRELHISHSIFVSFKKKKEIIKSGKIFEIGPFLGGPIDCKSFST